MDNKVVFKFDGENIVVTVAPTDSSWGSITADYNSDIIGMMMISITRIDGNIIIINNIINKTLTRIGKDNISNLETGIGADLELVIGTEVRIDLGAKLGAAIGLALRLELGSGLGLLLGIGTSI